MKLGVFALVAATGLVGCSGSDNTPGEENTTTPADAPPTTAPGAAAPFATVTFDGSTCSMERTADTTEAGVVIFEAVNATDQRVMFDSWQLLDGYASRAFKTTVERDRRMAEEGKPGRGWPSEREVTYLQSDVISANSSRSIVTTMSPGRHAIVCLKLYEGEPRDSRFRPGGIVGPIVVR